jgi:hypothetical protein
MFSNCPTTAPDSHAKAIPLKTLASHPVTLH